MIDAVTASCRYCSAQKLTPVMTTTITARSTCQRQWRVLIRAIPLSGSRSAEAKMAWKRKRSHTTTTTGTLATSHFALPSSSANST